MNYISSEAHQHQTAPNIAWTLFRIAYKKKL